MDALRIEGNRPLNGCVSIEGAKNAALPACVAALLTAEPIVLHRVPQLRDVSTILFTLSDLGKRVVRNEDRVVISEGTSLSPNANAYSVRQMRASFLVLGPLVARLGEARVPLPGGCAIGQRPVDLHLDGLRALGADIEERDGAVVVRSDGLRGAGVNLRFPSVGATEHLLMAAAVARGETTLRNASVEPEVLDLVGLLRSMGARIERSGRTYTIHGGTLNGATHRLMSDRMEAGTYLLAGAMTGGRVSIEIEDGDPLRPFLDVLVESGATIEESAGRITVSSPNTLLPVSVETAPHPGFPTDLHPPLVSFLSGVVGESKVLETVFESRFAYVAELCRMGARIRVSGSCVTVCGGTRLRGSDVEATDIRAGAALVLAALAANGTSTITGIDQLDRGYSRLDEKLRLLGAKVERITL